MLSRDLALDTDNPSLVSSLARTARFAPVSDRRCGLRGCSCCCVKVLYAVKLRSNVRYQLAWLAALCVDSLPNVLSTYDTIEDAPLLGYYKQMPTIFIRLSAASICPSHYLCSNLPTPIATYSHAFINSHHHPIFTHFCWFACWVSSSCSDWSFRSCMSASTWNLSASCTPSGRGESTKTMYTRIFVEEG